MLSYLLVLHSLDSWLPSEVKVEVYNHETAGHTARVQIPEWCNTHRYPTVGTSCSLEDACRAGTLCEEGICNGNDSNLDPSPTPSPNLFVHPCTPTHLNVRVCTCDTVYHVYCESVTRNVGVCFDLSSPH